MDLVNLFDVEAAARERLSRDTFDYFASGAQDEVTLRENRRAFDRVTLRYRVLVDVARRELATSVLGTRVASPILIAPMAFQRLAHPDGELATARAAAAAGTVIILSTLASAGLEEVRAATRAALWFQLYVYKDRGATRELVERAEAAGYGALVLTVDAPVLGRRERDLRNRFRLPEQFQLPTSVADGEAQMKADAARRAPAALADAPPASELATLVARMVDPSLSWRDVDWLRSITRLPLVVKGIVRGDDACRAAEHGASAVVVSNHGGRQLDTAVATIRALPEVVDVAGGRLEILIDGGVRRGTDVIKALALGAKAVLVGRPVLWGLALDGERGVSQVLEMLRAEFDLAMALCGCSTIGDVTRDLVVA
jgi:4-hydroxymandelate oxidase